MSKGLLIFSIMLSIAIVAILVSQSSTALLVSSGSEVSVQEVSVCRAEASEAVGTSMCARTPKPGDPCTAGTTTGTWCQIRLGGDRQMTCTCVGAVCTWSAWTTCPAGTACVGSGLGAKCA
jgi:hypothetical protein